MNGADLDENDEIVLERFLNIQKKRIMGTLTKAATKIAVIVCIDEILKDNGEAIAHLYSPEELEQILKYYKKYEKYQSKSRTLMSHKSSSLLKEVKADKLSDVIRLLFNNDTVQEFAECYVSKMEGLSKEFYEGFIKLINIIEDKINVTSTQRRSYEKKLGRLWKTNEINKSYIEEYKNTMDEIDDELQVKLEEGFEKIKNCRQSIEEMKLDTTRNYNTIITQSEKLMAQRNMTSEEETVELTENAQNEMEKYKKLLEEHLHREKQLRQKRYKIETVLVNKLMQYDQEMHELQEIFEDIEERFDAEKELMDEIQEKFDEQEKTYIICMEEKTLEEQRIFDEQFIEIMRLFAAKKIQKWWRYVIYKRTKKGKRKKKNK